LHQQINIINQKQKLKNMKKLLLILVSFALLQTTTKAQVGCAAYLMAWQTPGTTNYTFVDSSYVTSGKYGYSASYIDFGNGQTQMLNTLPGSTYTMQYVAGSYNVCIYIQDSVNQSCMDTFCQTITVTSNTLPACQATFSIWPDSLNAGVYYGSNNSSTTGSNPVYTWSWGDGSTSTGQFPSHTYAASGTYMICLGMTASGGGATCNDSFCIVQVVARMKGSNAMHSITILDPNAPNGINNLTSVSKLNVYPNPASSELNIEMNNEKVIDLKITSISGQLMNAEFDGKKVQIKNLNSGVYFIEVKTASNIFRTKFIKE
jgi:PKD repeat protein